MARTFLIAALICGCLSGAFAEVKLERGVALFENEQYDDARLFFEKAVKEGSDDSRVYAYLGRIAHMQHEWDDAVKFLERSVELDAQNASAHLWLGEAYIEKLERSNFLKKKGLANKARDRFIRAVELAPEDLDARYSLITFYLEAPGIVGGSKEKALENIEFVKTIDKRQGHLLMADYYIKTEKWEAAEQEYLAVAAMEPGDPYGHFRVGRMYQDSKKWNQAVAAFERCLEIDPDYMRAIYQIGRSAVLSGQGVERGIECFRRYLTMEPTAEEPSLAWAHVRLGMLYEQKREFHVAREQYETALALEPDHKEAKKALKKVKRR